MIIHASRRTDIPAFFSDWFLNRLEEGYACVRNPFDPKQVSRVALDPQAVDGFVFWTKDPSPMIPHLDRLEPYPYYLNVTINPYGPSLEAAVPRRGTVVTESFLRIADLVGPDRLVWFYDPVFLTERHTVESHLDSFERIARKLEGATDCCSVGFLTFYKSVERAIAGSGIVGATQRQRDSLLRGFRDIANAYGMELRVCADGMEGVPPGTTMCACVDAPRLERISGMGLLPARTDRGCESCRCHQTMDIGAYGTCMHGCVYCYANARYPNLLRNYHAHDPASELLIGHVRDDDRVVDTKMTRVTVAPRLPLFRSA